MVGNGSRPRILGSLVRRHTPGGRPAGWPDAGRPGRQRDALRADVRTIRAGPGRGPNGSRADRPVVRAATDPRRPAAALSSGADHHLRRSWRAGRRDGGHIVAFAVAGTPVGRATAGRRLAV